VLACEETLKADLTETEFFLFFYSALVPNLTNGNQTSQIRQNNINRGKVDQKKK
jgi:hypothetical protein